MNRSRHANRNLALWLAGALALSSVAFAAEDHPVETGSKTSTQDSTAATHEADKNLSNDAIAELKAQLAAQQKQIEQLRQALEAQQKMLDRTVNASAPTNVSAPVRASAPVPDGPEERNVSPYSSLGEVAGRTPIVPLGSPVAGSLQKPGSDGGSTSSPLSFGIGSSRWTPFGFIDVTNVFRSTNAGGGIGTGFGGIPFNNAAAGKLSEDRFSLQNSRLGLRIDSKFKGTDVTGYLETDFLGNAPTNLVVTSNANTLRMRLFWVQLKQEKWEFLAGQSWSLMTPGRKGISPIPGDIFYSQDFDTNYQLGLIWARQPGIRFVYHPTKELSWALAAEAADPYIGGAVTFSTALNGSAFPSEFNNGTAGTAAPPLAPDFISKLAYDTDVDGKHMHAEIAGLLSTFRTYNPLTNQHYTHIGGGGSANFNFELAKGFRFIANTFVSDGGGRYIFGLAPDLVPRQSGDISLVHSGSTVDGFEYSFKPKDNPDAKESLLYAYYGGTYIRKNFGIDASGKAPVLFGYGYPGSSLSANRSIQEATFGVNQTFWKSANYGDLRLLTQYSYLTRDPWSVPASNTQRNAHTHMVFINLRYDLP